jgi:hypothetical protein
MPETNPNVYLPVSDFLQQGDIFRLETVTPFADHQQRIFRTSDGRHGSLVFSDGVPGVVFDPVDLRNTFFERGPLDPMHTQPFQMTRDGQHELVVVFATLVQFFVIATQTCDVSSQDKPAQSHVIILPAKLLSDICRTEQIPFPGMLEPMTIEGYLTHVTNSSDLQGTSEPFEYGDKLRALLASWQPITKNEIQNKGRIKNLLSKFLDGSGYVHYLKRDIEFRIPEMCVDFSAAYTVALQQLTSLSGNRIARIGDPYRDQFAQAFAHHISRIALPEPVKPPPF